MKSKIEKNKKIMSNSWIKFRVLNELKLTSRIKLLMNSKQAELKLEKEFISNSDWILSRTNSYRVEFRQVRLDSFSALKYAF
jgi:hypothetical protein